MEEKLHNSMCSIKLSGKYLFTRAMCVPVYAFMLSTLLKFEFCICFSAFQKFLEYQRTIKVYWTVRYVHMLQGYIIVLLIKPEDYYRLDITCNIAMFNITYLNGKKKESHFLLKTNLKKGPSMFDRCHKLNWINWISGISISFVSQTINASSKLTL